MKNFLLISLLLLISWRSFSQDERSLMRLFRNKDANYNDKAFADFTLKQKESWVVDGLKFDIDLDGDGKREKLFFKKVDGEDFFVVASEDDSIIEERRLDKLGEGSFLYKVQLKTISSALNTIVLHYYEGFSKYTEFWGTSRIYLLTYKRDDFKVRYFFKGPSVFIEHESHGKDYYKELYKIDFEDVNHDNIKELLLVKENWKKTWYYAEQGIWKNP